MRLLAVYRLGSHIPTPGVDPVALAEFFKAMAGGVFGFLDLFSGGALRRLSVFALGIMPYISASIILQLLTVVWPYLEKLSKEGEMGRRKINQYTRYGTVAAVDRAVARRRVLAQEPGRSGRRAAGSARRSGLRLGHRLPDHDRAHAHHRHRLHHVAR